MNSRVVSACCLAGLTNLSTGKLCDILGSEADICARATGGRNCGHSELFLSVVILKSSLTSHHASAVVADGVSYDLFVHTFHHCKFHYT